MLFDKGKLEKLTLRAYKPAAGKNEPPQVSDDPKDMYVAQVNPNTYQLSQLLNHSRHLAPGSSKSEAVYNHSPPVNLTFDFLFDGTGVVPEPSELGDVPLVGALASALTGGPKKFVVSDEIKKFEKLVYIFNGKIHSPRQLLLVWGKLAFSCVMSSVSYRFTLFKPDGTPLRAIATCAFCESEPTALTERKQNATSPDLTHLRDVRDGDSLPALAYEIYGKPELYFEVARVNKLVNFRKLRSASRVAFPPLEAKA
jgi:hypothetical protein